MGLKRWRKELRDTKYPLSLLSLLLSPHSFHPVQNHFLFLEQEWNKNPKDRAWQLVCSSLPQHPFASPPWFERLLFVSTTASSQADCLTKDWTTARTFCYAIFNGDTALVRVLENFNCVFFTPCSLCLCLFFDDNRTPSTHFFIFWLLGERHPPMSLWFRGFFGSQVSFFLFTLLKFLFSV